MVDYGRFMHRTPAPSRQNLDKTCAVVESSLAEMKIIVSRVSSYYQPLAGADKYRLLYLGSNIYDFYLLAEDCLLHIARTIDRWVPASLDWRARLIKLMQSPFPEKRPPVISTATALLLSQCLSLFLNFHHQCATLTPARIIKLLESLGPLCSQLEEELTAFTRLIKPKA
ncbi:MAG: hypothetical protein U1E11_10500 [Dethiobacteria bacterium]|nr:hypothetical protein [Dethiobacteria bacterium]